jgi:hydrogenase-4 component F
MVVVIFAGLIHHAGRMAFGDPSAGMEPRREPTSSVVGMLLLAIVMVVLGLFLPPWLDHILSSATEIILG